LAQTGILEATAAFITPLPLFGAVLSPGTPLLGTAPMPVGFGGTDPMPGIEVGAGIPALPNMLGAGAGSCVGGAWAVGAATRWIGAGATGSVFMLGWEGSNVDLGSVTAGGLRASTIKESSKGKGGAANGKLEGSILVSRGGPVNLGLLILVHTGALTDWIPTAGSLDL